MRGLNRPLGFLCYNDLNLPSYELRMEPQLQQDTLASAAACRAVIRLSERQPRSLLYCTILFHFQDD